MEECCSSCKRGHVYINDGGHKRRLLTSRIEPPLGLRLRVWSIRLWKTRVVGGVLGRVRIRITAR